MGRNNNWILTFSVALGLLLMNATSELYAREQEPADTSISHKSPFLAVTLSTVATLAPLALSAWGNPGDHIGGLLASSGLLFGPAVGYLYGGATGRGLAGVGIRAGTACLTIGIGALAIAGRGDDGVGTILVIGCLAFAGEVIYDMFAVGSYISDINAREDARRQGLSFHLSPTYNSDTRTTGIHLNLNF